MSLFGDDDSPSRTKSSGLFDEVPKAKHKGGSGLFADDLTGSDDSPWEFSSPKKTMRGNIVKSLLPHSAVPESYIGAFDSLTATGHGKENSIKLTVVRDFLTDSEVDPSTQATILEIVTRGQDLVALDRNEFYVVLALIGLAQEGEDVTLDGVDERKNDLPQPLLPLSERQEQASLTKDPETPSTSISKRQPERGQTMRKQSFGFPENDPWASPALHKGHNHQVPVRSEYNNGLGLPSGISPIRTTSNFTTHSNQQEIDSVDNQASAPRISTAGGWSSYVAPTSAEFANDNLGGGFGDPGGEGNGRGPPGIGASLGGSTRIASTGTEEVVTVTAIQEKEGIFLFQHRNYEVTSARRNSKVVRRYSDFVWLLDCLQKRFPFRQLPLLPPKRVAINGNHLAANVSFIEKRRRGLARFASALVRHPVLSQEQLVVMFLTVPTELAVWRKQAQISVQEEFTGKSLPSGLEDSLSPTLPELFDQIRSGIKRSAEVYIDLCSLVERLVKRNEGLAADYLRISNALTLLTEASNDTYATDTNDVPLLNSGISSTARYLTNSRSLLHDEARAWDEGVLEDLKRQRDSLVSMRDMFDRRDKYAKDNISQLEKRINGNESKLANIRAKPDNLIKPGEAEKVEEAIVRDKQSIVDQHARGILIKECVRDEIMFFSKSQYHISRLHQDWSQERVKYAELQADNWRTLSEEVENMPLGD
ncbi:sorting nexin mvp1 [Pseudovirgaria hyperparasitica]|uniref:Sorting nexin MVP1 n=1 Tax=Pseudovirgaria hyperparasitica TaxID=470096 RepID=A0A6A6WK74_9PEZI|nr:sorting nexin mvp1 [Pseudovirgaria hyperparasitica]KAF2762571.1 sorting nexin mvp1 [Pseudovirgaria hyperparasitica]